MNKKIGFTCAYTPVPLIEAAGFSPFRIFPESKAPDQAGHLLHDNLCPHVKKVLDRAIADDLPDLGGMVFINSCDSMRRLSDAWHETRPDDRIILLDLPSGINSLSLDFLSKEYERLTKTLFKWNNETFSPEIISDKIKDKIDNWNLLAASVKKIEGKMSLNYFPGIASRLQQIINTAATDSTDKALVMAQKEIGPEEPAKAGRSPVFIFGNLLFDPKVFDLFEEWNMHVTASDFCTTSRFITPVETKTDNNIFRSLADSYLKQTPCARTMDTTKPGSIALDYFNRSSQLLKDIYDLAKTKPSPVDNKLLRDFGTVMILIMGTQQGVDICQAFKDELNHRIETCQHHASKEKIRLMWIQNRIQYPFPIDEMLDDLGAKIVVDELNDVTWEPMDPSKPFESIAKRMISIPYSMGTSERIKHMQTLAGDYEIDGAINPCHWGCRQGTGTRGLISKGLKDVNVPVLNLEIDCVDSRNLAKGQIETRIEAFIEMLS